MRRAKSSDLTVDVQWFNDRRDTAAVMAIEEECFLNEYCWPWSEAEMLGVVAMKEVSAMVARSPAMGNRIVGFIVYAIYSDSIAILSVATAWRVRRRGVGTQMINAVMRKLNRTRRELRAEVSDLNEEAHQFFVKAGLGSSCLVRDGLGDGLDAYRFWTTHDKLFEQIFQKS